MTLIQKKYCVVCFCIAALSSWFAFFVNAENSIEKTTNSKIVSKYRERKSNSDASFQLKLHKRNRQTKESQIKKISSSRDAALRDAYEYIQIHGDYSKLEEIIKMTEKVERIEIFIGSLKRVHSRLGNEHDVKQKLMLISKYGGDISKFARSQVMHDFGTRIDMKLDVTYIKSLNANDWKMVAKGLADSNPEKAFDVTHIDLCEDQIKTLVVESTRAWLDLDSISASQYVSAMPSGLHKEIAVREIVNWLIARGDTAVAQQWNASIGRQD